MWPTKPLNSETQQENRLKNSIWETYDSKMVNFIVKYKEQKMGV